MTTYSEIVQEIANLDEELGRWHSHYSKLREQLQEMDRQILALHRRKWRLEKELVPVTRCKPQEEPTRRGARPKREELNFDIKNMTLDELQRVLAELKRQRAEEEDD